VVFFALAANIRLRREEKTLQLITTKRRRKSFVKLSSDLATINDYLVDKKNRGREVPLPRTDAITYYILCLKAFYRIKKGITRHSSDCTDSPYPFF